MNKAERAAVRGVERRNYAVNLQVLAASAGPAGTVTLDGYATITDTPFEMWDFYGTYAEVIQKGAFARTLNANPEVQLLLNHGGMSMAYTKAGRLRLEEDDHGLRISADVNPGRHDVHDMLAAIEDQDVDEMSFAFRVTRQKWSPDYDQRDILEIDLHRGDVSVVNFGANYHTEGSLVVQRSADLDRMGDEDARVLYERLGRRLAPKPEGMPLGLAMAEASRLGLPVHVG
jgi:HK97 family phage prohead protease